jgi:DNA-directed RNA polymerase specialized sigma24 family protein
MRTNNLNLAYAAYDDDSSQGNLNALLAEVRKYAYTVCIRRGIRQEDATDVAQDTAFDIWCKLFKYDHTRSSFRTWVHRCTLDQVSINRRKVEGAAKTVDAHQSAPADHRHSRRNPRIDEARRLAGDNTKLIDLVLVHGDIAAAAHQLGITPLAAHRRLRRIGRKINLTARSKSSAQMP